MRAVTAVGQLIKVSSLQKKKTTLKSKIRNTESYFSTCISLTRIFGRLFTEKKLPLKSKFRNTESYFATIV